MTPAQHFEKWWADNARASHPNLPPLFKEVAQAIFCAGSKTAYEESLEIAKLATDATGDLKMAGILRKLITAQMNGQLLD